ncbi:MAG: hypothetical protein NVSMB25_01290 [Thermoleophilaceae bacterium]
MSVARDLAGTVSSARIADQARRIRNAGGLGPPALAAMTLSALASSILFILGVVSKHALGLTPVVFLASSVFFVITTMTYIEGSTIHPEQGGASTLARYAFDEFWSFVAGWAMLLDYLIVMSIAVLAVSSYLAAFWAPLGHGAAKLALASLTIALVVLTNIRGISAARFGRVLRIGLTFVVLAVVIVVAGLLTEFRPGRVVDSIHLGSSPRWHELLFAAVLTTVAATGIEAASGLAPEIRVPASALRRLVSFTVIAGLVVLVGVSAVATMAAPTLGQGERWLGAPLLGVVSGFHTAWLRDVLRYSVGLIGAAVLAQVVNGTMLGVSRLTYSLATNRQIPSLLGRLDPRASTPFVAIGLAGVVTLALASTTDVEFLAGIYAFGAMLVFTIAHLSVITLRFREPERTRIFRVPWSIAVGSGTVPVPAALGAIAGVLGWISVLILHAGARYVGGVWMVGGVVLYTIYRRTQGKPLRKRFTIPASALHEAPGETDYGSILVPVFGTALDDDIVGTAGRLAAEDSAEGEGGAVIEALFVLEVPMSLPLDARVSDEQIARAKRAVARAKQVGEEYEGVEVATATVRSRSVGAAIVSEAKRRGVEAIVLAAEEPARVRGGALLGGRGAGRDRSVGEITRYVVDKAPCRVILTAAPLEPGNGAVEAPPI